jgi:DNA-binding CsgD family transcriptional regulator
MADMERLSSDGLDLDSFRREALRRLRTSVPIDAAFFASVDPSTMLFTSALAETPLAAVTALFLDNEYVRDDVNKFARLAAAYDPVGSLDRSTNGDRATSARYRDVLAPIGMGDELRVALMAGGLCWGVLCLHRTESPLGFDAAEVDFVRRVAPLLAGGLRRTVALFPAVPDASSSSGPGIIILDADLSVVSINPRAESILADIVDSDWPTHFDLPAPIYAAAAHLLGNHREMVASPTATRLRRGGGGWVTVQASSLNGSAGRQVAVVLDAADTGAVSSLLLAAHGLTPAQSRVVALVLQGRSTPSIVNELHISANTLQEHLHVVFDKLGIGSRRELVAALSVRGSR